MNPQPAQGPPSGPPSGPRAGRRLGAYQVVGELGRGASAIVFRALAADGRPVAIKLLLRPSPLVSARFAREARLLASPGPGFVPVLGHGVEVGADGVQRPYLVLPLLEGGSLADRLRLRGPLATGDATALGATLAGALADLHARGSVHRDVKPANVLFDGRDRPHLADLGLGVDAQGALGESARLTATHEGGGTPGYMAPEQLEGLRQAGPPADVFALGATLYEALAGRAAFEGQGVLERLARAASGDATPLREVRPEVPAWLADLVHACLVTSPAERPTAAALSRALTRGEATSRRALGRRTPPAALAAMISAGALVAAGLVIALARDARAPSDPPGEPAAETSTTSVADPLAHPVADPVAHPLAHPLADPVADPNADPLAHPNAHPARPRGPGAGGRVGQVLARLEGARVEAVWTQDAEVLIAELAIVPGPPRVAVPAADGAVRLLSLATGRELERLAGRGSPLLALRASEDGLRLAAADGAGRLLRWRREGAGPFVAEPDVDVPACVVSFAAASLFTVDAAGDSWFVEPWGATRRAGRVGPTWYLASREGVAVFAGRSSSGIRAATSGGGPLDVEVHTAPVRGLALSPGGAEALSLDRLGAVVRWRTSSGEVLSRHDAPQRAGVPRAVCWSGDLMAAVFEHGVALVGGGPPGLRTWDLQGVSCAALAPDGTLVVGADDGGLAAFDLATPGSLRALWAAPGASVRAVGVGWLRPGQAFVADAGGLVRSFDPQEPAAPRVAAELASAVRVAWGEPGADFVTGGADGYVRVFPSSPGSRLVGARTRGRSGLVGIAGRGPVVVTLDADGALDGWDFAPANASGQVRRALQVKVPGATALTVMNDGPLRVAVGAAAGQLVLLDARDQLTPLGEHPAAITALARTAAGLVLGDEGGAVVEVTLRGDEELTRTRLGQHPQPILALASSPDGRLVASIGRDETLMVWSSAAPGARGFVDLEPLRDAPTCAAFALDGRALLMGTRRGRVLLVRLEAP